MNDNVRGVPGAYTNQPVVLPGRRVDSPLMRVEPQVSDEYSRATASNGYPIVQTSGAYAVPQQIEPNRFSDPVRRYSHSHRPSGYIIPRSGRRTQSLRGLVPASELPINDAQNAPVKSQEPDIVYYGYPDSNREGNVPPSNAQYAKPPHQHLPENEEREAPLLKPNIQDPRYVLEDDVIIKEDSVSSSKIFKLRELLRMQQKLMLGLFGMLVLVIIVLIIVVALLLLNKS